MWVFGKLKRSANEDEWKAFKYHLGYAIPDGIILGILALNEFVFIRSLSGSSYQLGFLFQFSMVVFVALFFIHKWLKAIPDKKRLLRKTAIITRLPLILLAVFPSNFQAGYDNPVWHYVFLLIFFIYYAGSPIIYPSINQFLKNAYSHSNFGYFFGIISSLNKLIMMAVTFGYGLLLDYDADAYRYVFPFVAILGVISIFFLSKLAPEKQCPKTKILIKTQVKQSMQQMLKTILNNKPYMHFEIGFMLYGFAFMGSVTLIPLFFDQILDLNYSSVAFYRNSYNILAILMLPFFGRLIGKIDPRKFAIITFLSMFMYVFFMAATAYFPASFNFWNIQFFYMMIGYIIFHGVFAATMSLLWSIGSAYFCNKEDAGLYQSIHLSLTGLRALIAPIMGIIFFEMWGFTAAFSLTMSLLIIGVVIMVWSYRRDLRR